MSIKRPSFVRPGMCVACAADGYGDIPAVGFGKIHIANCGIELCYAHLRETEAMGWETHLFGESK